MIFASNTISVGKFSVKFNFSRQNWARHPPRCRLLARGLKKDKELNFETQPGKSVLLLEEGNRKLSEDQRDIHLTLKECNKMTRERMMDITFKKKRSLPKCVIKKIFLGRFYGK